MKNLIIILIMNIAGCFTVINEPHFVISNVNYVSLAGPDLISYTVTNIGTQPVYPPLHRILLSEDQTCNFDEDEFLWLDQEMVSAGESLNFSLNIQDLDQPYFDEFNYMFIECYDIETDYTERYILPLNKKGVNIHINNSSTKTK